MSKPTLLPRASFLAALLALTSVGIFATCALAAAPTGDAKKDALRSKLTPLQYEVTQEAGTEPPFHNAYWNNHAPGIYVDIVSGEPLFSSTDKFESGTGWPSFTRPLVDDNVVQHTDYSLWMQRIEVRSKGANSHLGHVFDDGPQPTGKRYCINSAALRFVPADHLVAEGYGQFAKLFPDVKQVGTAPAPASSASASAKPANAK